MSEDCVLDQRHILIIDGGNVYPRLVRTLGDCFSLHHEHCPTLGLEYAQNACNLDGVMVDLQQGVIPNSALKPSLLGLWVVEQLREFRSCATIPIAVVSHWQQNVIEKTAVTFGAISPTYDYFRMSNIDEIIEYFATANTVD